MAHVKLQNASLEYVEHGSGAPVIFIHGTLEDYRVWNAQKSVFAESFRGIAYSRRYHFPNAARGDETDYAPKLHADDLGEMMDALGIERAYLVGASYGAYCALTFATMYPERVSACVLGEPPIIPWLLETPHEAEIARMFYERAWRPAGDAFARDETETALRLFVDGVNRPGTYERLNERTLTLLRQNAPALKIETQSPDYFQPLDADRVAALEMPMLLLGAQYSPAHFALILDRLQRLVPQARRVTLEKTGHAMNLGNVELYNATVLTFLREMQNQGV